MQLFNNLTQFKPLAFVYYFINLLIFKNII